MGALSAPTPHLPAHCRAPHHHDNIPTLWNCKWTTPIKPFLYKSCCNHDASSQQYKPKLRYCLTTRSHGRISSSGAPSSLMTLACVMLTNRTSQPNYLMLQNNFLSLMQGTVAVLITNNTVKRRSQNLPWAWVYQVKQAVLSHLNSSDALARPCVVIWRQAAPFALISSWLWTHGRS